MDPNSEDIDTLERSETLTLDMDSQELSSLIAQTSFTEKFIDSGKWPTLFEQQESITRTADQQENITDTTLIEKKPSWDFLENETLSALPSTYANEIVSEGKQIFYATQVPHMPIGNKVIFAAQKVIENHIEDESPPSIYIEATGIPSLSFQPMIGVNNFNLRLKSNKHNSNKWCFSEVLKKLFVQPQIAVPVEITVNNWTNCYLNVTPVFIESQDRSLPVTRCPNHIQSDLCRGLDDCAEHILQVENNEAIYSKRNNRHCVDIPFGQPAPGEDSIKIFVKLGCWTTCVGGPHRKPFSLLFTLFDGTNVEIGRQILMLKVCSCPKRDLDIMEKRTGKTTMKRTHGKSPGKKALATNKKIKTEVNTTSTSSSLTSQYEDILVPVEFVSENSTSSSLTSQYEGILIPVEFVSEVKKFVNQLVAEKLIRESLPCLTNKLPFPPQ